MFFTKRLVVLLLVLLILVELGETASKAKNKKKGAGGAAAKKNNKNKGGGGKNKNKNKNKAKNTNKNKNKNKNKKKNKNKNGGLIAAGQSYVTPKDKTYWPSGGNSRLWSKQDSPLYNKEFLEAYNTLVGALKSSNIPINKLTSMQIMSNLTLVDEWFRAITRVEELATPTFVLSDTSGTPNGYTFAAHLDSKQGSDLPPILQNYCPLHECVEAGVKYVGEMGFYIPVSAYPISQVYDRNKESLLTEQLFDDLIHKILTSLGTFTNAAMNSMICKDSYLKTADKSVESFLDTLPSEITKFTKKPGQTTKFQAERKIITIHEEITAKMLKQLLKIACK